MTPMLQPLGLGFWLAVAGYVGCCTLVVFALRTSQDKRRSARLTEWAVSGLLTLQSLRLLTESFDDASQLQRSLAGAEDYDRMADQVARFPLESLLMWFTGVALGVTLVRLFQLYSPKQA